MAIEIMTGRVASVSSSRMSGALSFMCAKIAKLVMLLG